MAEWIFDANFYKENDFISVPAGDHRVRIEDVVEKTFRSGNVGFEITLAVNKFSSRLWYYIVLDKSNPERTNQRLGEFFNCFGITNYTLGNGKQWIGAAGAVKVKMEEYNGKESPKVAYCISRKNQEKLEPWVSQGTAAAQPMADIDIPNNLPFDM